MRSGVRGRWAVLCVLCALFAVGVAACGSDDNSGSTGAASTPASTTPASTTPASTEPSSSGSGVDQASAEIDKYRAAPTWEAPGPAFDAKKAAGKTVFNTPTVSANAFVKAFTDTQGDVAKLVGLKYTDCANGGTVAEWAKCQTQAIGQGPDLILLGGPDPAVLGPQLKEAASKNIPVISAALYDPSMPKVPGVAAWTFEPYQVGARLMADYAIKETDGKANVVIVTSNELGPSKGMVSAIKDELVKLCGDGCKSTEVNVALPDWATKMQGAIQSALVADPTVNYVLPIYDPMLSFAVAAVQGAGRAGKVSVASYNGTAAALKMIQDGDVVKMIVGQDLTCIGYSDMDPVLRILAGVDPVDNVNKGLRVWDDSNIAEAGTPPNQTQGYGTACTDGFKKLWGLE